MGNESRKQRDMWCLTRAGKWSRSRKKRGTVQLTPARIDKLPINKVETLDPSGYDLNYDWYIDKAQSIINLIDAGVFKESKNASIKFYNQIQQFTSLTEDEFIHMRRGRI